MKNDLSLEQLRQEVTVCLPLSVVLRITEQRDDVPPAVDAVAPGNLPAIGAPYQGGTYAGLTLHENRPMALVLLNGENERCTWSEAKAWAEELGGELPSRFDQLVLFKNLKSAFAEAWYWSGQQHAGNESYAWSQVFDNGYQDWNRVGDGNRARAVRRLVIQ